jgi:hypothetical protein
MWHAARSWHILAIIIQFVSRQGAQLMIRLAGILLTGVATLICTNAQAANVEFHEPHVRMPSAAESNVAEQPVPAGSEIVNFFLTSDADILSISFVHAQGGPLYNYAGDFPPPSLIVPLPPPFTADSWIRLAPTGRATVLGVDLPGDGTDYSTWGDTVNTPMAALVNFNFAQLTFLPGSTWRFSGIVNVSGATGPEAYPFDFREVPEPLGALLATCGFLGLQALQRRANAWNRQRGRHR